MKEKDQYKTTALLNRVLKNNGLSLLLSANNININSFSRINLWPGNCYAYVKEYFFKTYNYSLKRSYFISWIYVFSEIFLPLPQKLWALEGPAAHQVLLFKQHAVWDTQRFITIQIKSNQMKIFQPMYYFLHTVMKSVFTSQHILSKEQLKDFIKDILPCLIFEFL